MMTLFEVLQRFREEAQGVTTAYGSAFEVLVKNILLHAPCYRAHFKHVWRWSELGLGQDIGIDLVAENEFGQLVGIQAKCYEIDHRVSKADIDSFLAALGGSIFFQGELRFFSQGMLFASTDAWNDTVEKELSARKPPCQLITFSEMNTWDVDWEVLAGFKDGQLVHEKPLRDYQLEALEDAHRHYASATRGRLIMACGTGKTLTALRIIEQETQGKGLVLFLVPSIALLNQTLVSWSTDTKVKIHSICVCSDVKANRRVTSDTDDLEENPNTLALPPTTSADEIARRLKYYRDNYPNDLIILFSTYQSIEMVEVAQAKLGREAYAFDFAVCDEAHRTTGAIAKEKKEPAFTYIHSNEHVLVRKRLYMTATPRLYSPASQKKAKELSIELCSMDDPEIYGEEFYHIGFGRAVEKGCLSDYKVLVLTIPEKNYDGIDLYTTLSEKERHELEKEDGTGRTTTAIKILGSINALAKRLVDSPLLSEVDGVPARRAVAFCRTIKLSQATTKLINDLSKREDVNLPLRVSTQHVDGGMSALERNQKLAWLKGTVEESECRILSNVRCLSEGVDVPSLDAAIFLAKRNSQIDVVQSVGRVMRRAHGKQYGYIIIPVVIPADKDPKTELANSETFGVVWSVLNALRAHDDRFEAEINQLNFKETRNEVAPQVSKMPSILISGGGETVQQTFELQFPGTMEEYRNLLYGRIVEHCGDRAYFERWAEDVATIAARYIEHLKSRCEEDMLAAKAFKEYYDFLQTAVYTTVSEEDARLMLAQQHITKPIFDALFGNNDFTQHNPVSKALDKAASLLVFDDDAGRRKLARFYESVQTRVKNIQGAEGKLEIIRTLYDTFFAKAFKKTAEKLGIVFTPIEVVDFILRSVDGAMQKFFGKRLTSPGVKILDPFTGTGTFVARLLQEDIGLIDHKDLYRKYTEELFANEIVLLSYYIAAVNIENIFHDRYGETTKYTPFPGVVFGDTFRMREIQKGDTLDDDVFMENSERLLHENDADISVIIGNPPYSIGQKSANDNAQNENYPHLNQRIEETYVKQSDAANNKSLYDAYITAFRWSSDRLNPKTGGILCYVSNGGWLDSSAGVGFRRCIQSEFDEIYVYNLRGNQNTQGEVSRREGGKIFDSGCRTPIAILLLVRLPDRKGHNSKQVATIHYRDIGDYKTRDEKLNTLDVEGSFFSPLWEETLITPNDHGDWINQRNEAFGNYIPLESKKKFDVKTKSFFVTHALGVATNRDAWVYSFSKEELSRNMQKTIATFNETLGLEKPYNPELISWSTNLSKAHDNGKTQGFDLNKIRISAYRPFAKQWQYFDQLWNERRGVSPMLFPNADSENLVICLSTGSLLIADRTPDLHFVGDSQCFPLYWYELKDEDLFGGKRYERYDGVSDFIVKEIHKRYKKPVTKLEIFYYVYGALHAPDYRAAFVADLKKSLPRLPLPESYVDFLSFSTIGKALADLHLNYETLDPYPVTEVGNFAQTRIEKMKFVGKDKTRININETLEFADIPLEAYDYVVNGRSPIEWVLDRYQVKVDKESGIVNDPNLWAPDDPTYIPMLIKRLITLSLKSQELIRQLPKLIL